MDVALVGALTLTAISGIRLVLAIYANRGKPEAVATALALTHGALVAVSIWLASMVPLNYPQPLNALVFSVEAVVIYAALSLLFAALYKPPVAQQPGGAYVIDVDDSSPFGITFGVGYKSLILVTGSGEVKKMILAHELAHARKRHVFKIGLLMVALFSLVGDFIFSNRDVASWLLFAWLFYTLILAFRVFEVSADYETYRALGPRAYGLFVKFLKERYGVVQPWRAPWRSRITHTDRRDLVLAFGDKAGPHWPLEFPLYFALSASAALIMVGAPRLFTLGIFVGSLLIVMLLGAVLQPLLASAPLTARGRWNLGFLFGGIILMASMAAALIGPASFLAAYFVFLYVGLYYLDREGRRKAFVRTTAAFLLLLALNLALGYVATRLGM
ncbi:MAG: hypothetical protein ABWK05_01680 [Pyrobaculum sp.]